jgi:hypothetical protein
MASCPEIEPTEFRLELVVPSWLPAELVTPVCVERTGRWPWSRSRTRCSRCVWPSGRPSIATHQPAESFVGDHHIARGFSLALAVALVRGAAVRSVDLAREQGVVMGEAVEDRVLARWDVWPSRGRSNSAT